MAYSISDCYKDLELILKRPINSLEFAWVESWFERYDPIYIQININICKTNPNIYRASYISNSLASHSSFYNELKNITSLDFNNLKNITITNNLDFNMSNNNSSTFDSNNIIDGYYLDGLHCSKYNEVIDYDTLNAFYVCFNYKFYKPMFDCKGNMISKPYIEDENGIITVINSSIT